MHVVISPPLTECFCPFVSRLPFWPADFLFLAQTPSGLSISCILYVGVCGSGYFYILSHYLYICLCRLSPTGIPIHNFIAALLAQVCPTYGGVVQNFSLLLVLLLVGDGGSESCL